MDDLVPRIGAALKRGAGKAFLTAFFWYVIQIIYTLSNLYINIARCLFLRSRVLIGRAKDLQNLSRGFDSPRDNYRKPVCIRAEA